MQTNKSTRRTRASRPYNLVINGVEEKEHENIDCAVVRLISEPLQVNVGTADFDKVAYSLHIPVWTIMERKTTPGDSQVFFPGSQR